MKVHNIITQQVWLKMTMRSMYSQDDAAPLQLPAKTTTTVSYHIIGTDMESKNVVVTVIHLPSKYRLRRLKNSCLHWLFGPNRINIWTDVLVFEKKENEPTRNYYQEIRSQATLVGGKKCSYHYAIFAGCNYNTVKVLVGGYVKSSLVEDLFELREVTVISL